MTRGSGDPQPRTPGATSGRSAGRPGPSLCSQGCLGALGREGAPGPRLHAGGVGGRAGRNGPCVNGQGGRAAAGPVGGWVGGWVGVAGAAWRTWRRGCGRLEPAGAGQQRDVSVCADRGGSGSRSGGPRAALPEYPRRASGRVRARQCDAGTEAPPRRLRRPQGPVGPGPGRRSSDCRVVALLDPAGPKLDAERRPAALSPASQLTQVL